MMTKNAKALGGTVSSCAWSSRDQLVPVYDGKLVRLQPEKPKFAMMVGAKKPKALSEFYGVSK